jgi:hypothetical protein
MSPIPPTTADEAIARVIVHAGILADCKMREMLLDGQRSQVKSEAITRLMSQPDPQKDGKLYSATAAAEIVMNDAAFALHEADRRAATAATIRAAGQYEAAKLAARLAVSGAEIEGFEPLRLALDASHAVVLT